MSVRYRLSTGSGTWTTAFAGLLDLTTPTLRDYGNCEVGFQYGITGSFTVAGVTYKFAGSFLVHDQGAGLWDATFDLPVSTSDGRSLMWESTNGIFYRADGTPYPSGSGASSHAYGVYPERVDFLNSIFRTIPFSQGLGMGTLIADRMCAAPSLDGTHLDRIDKKITALSNALATLGRGTDLRELLQIIRHPGWTTPAELAFCMSLLDGMELHAQALTSLSARLLAASKLVAPEQ